MTAGDVPAVALQIEDLAGVVAFGQMIRANRDALDGLPADTHGGLNAVLSAIWGRLAPHTPPELVGVPIPLSLNEADAVVHCIRATLAAVREHPAAAPAFDSCGIDTDWLIAIRGVLETGQREARRIRAERLN